MRESDIQTAILKEFGAQPGVLMWRNHVGVGVPARYVQMAIKHLRRGQPALALSTLAGAPTMRFSVSGSSDLFAVKEGHFFGIEVKALGGRQSKEQVKWQAALEAAGGTYTLARDVEDVTL